MKQPPVSRRATQFLVFWPLIVATRALVISTLRSSYYFTTVNDPTEMLTFKVNCEILVDVLPGIFKISDYRLALDTDLSCLNLMQLKCALIPLSQSFGSDCAVA